MHGPGEPPVVEASDVEVYLKHRGSGPSGIAGIDPRRARAPVRRRRLGRLPVPVHIQRRGLQPITGKVHQPPPVHQVFEGHNFVICNFVPRKVDYHPLRSRCPTTTPTSTPTR